jgi:hypothetical protein
MDANAADLRYIKADHLSTTTAGELQGTSVMGQADTTLGILAGALVDPVHRTVCYLVIESRNWLTKHSYLLPLGLTRLDQSRQALLVDASAADLQEVQMDRFAPFSEEDLIAAMFSPRAA